MKLAEFSEIFDQLVVNPLCDKGFKVRGKALYLRDDVGCFSIIRLGGRMAREGCISFIGCYRHNLLRGLDGKIPPEYTGEVYSYPYKFKPSRSRKIGEYTPKNSQIIYDTVKFESNSNVEKELHLLTSNILNIQIPSSKLITEEVGYEELKSFGENAWIETMWLEDYRKLLA